MPLLQIYAYDAGEIDEPLLVDEVADLEEAMARCHELVETDGYSRAELWDAAGDCRYGVALRGGTLRTYGTPRDDDASGAPFAPHTPPVAPPEIADAADPRLPAPLADLPSRRDDQLSPDLIFGQQPGRPPEQWFGL